MKHIVLANRRRSTNARLLDGQQGLEEFVQQEQKAKDDALASVQGSLQQLNTECTALGDAVQLLCVRAQQIENTAARSGPTATTGNWTAQPACADGLASKH